MLIAESEKDMKNMFYNVKKIRADEKVWNWMAKTHKKNKQTKKKTKQTTTVEVMVKNTKITLLIKPN